VTKLPAILTFTGLCGAGFLTGFSAQSFRHRPTSSGGKAGSEVIAGSRNPNGPEAQFEGDRRAVKKAPLIEFPHIRSTETVESLLNGDRKDLYSRLAAWMTDASEADIAAYWSGYKQQPNRSNDITDLVFLNWARHDPKAAIAANAGGPEEHYAWWAWACHDPKAALAAALAENSDRVNNVAWGIGEFHPQWLREHFNELPESARSNAMRGLMKWDDGQNPLEALKFMKEHGYGANAGTLKALVRQDPWAALDWVKQNPGSQQGYNGYIEDPMALVVKTMAQEHPEDLERLIAQTPSGQLKVRLEAALFERLMQTDPAAALAQAQATTVPRVAAERYAALGAEMVKDNPEQAFELAKSLFTVCPDALQMMVMVEYPNGSSGSSITVPGVGEFVAALMPKDPARVLEMTLDLPKDRFGSSAFNTLSSQWAERDLVGYSTWVNQQTDVQARDQGASIIGNYLMQDGNFAEAMEWSMSTQNGIHNIENYFMNWQQSNPDEAAEWLADADLPAERKQRLKAILEAQP
jgi:hypothetical protein